MDDELKTEKISGYLEKKGKLKVMTSWKKYWFVLEGRLLLYYRSKDEYDAISPCKGSINLGPPCFVKSCPSMPGVFQIETRNNTVTLRAENRKEQNRWMQAMMAALNQIPRASKLSHFRYSFDDLVPSISKKKPENVKPQLERQNTMPERFKTKNPKKKNQIIQRLQKIGAKSYVDNADTHNGTVLNDNDNVNTGLKENTETNKEVIKNDTINNHLKKKDKTSDKKMQRKLKERDKHNSENTLKKQEKQNKEETKNEIPYKGLESPKSLTIKTLATNDDLVKNQFQIENVESGINYSQTEIPNDKEKVLTDDEDENIYERIPQDFMVNNDNYDTSCKKRDIKRSSSEDANGILIENDQYMNSEARKRRSQSLPDSEMIYSELKLEATDQNKNSIVFESPQYICIDDEDFSECKGDESPRICKNQYETVKMESDDIYSKPDEYIKENELYNQSSSENHKSKTKSRLKSFIKQISGESDEKNKDGTKLKKSKSFVKKLWSKRRSKSKEEDIYAEIVDGSVEKNDSSETDTTVQMLNELQNVLVHKISHGLVNSDSSTISEKQSPTEKFTGHGTTPEIKIEVTEDRTENCAVKTSNDCDSINNNVSSKLTAEEKNCKAESSDEEQPVLPKKTIIHKTISPFHDVPKNNQPVVPPKTAVKQQSLDEILDDLNKEKREIPHKNRVKQLIEIFDEHESENVVLRKYKDEIRVGDFYRHSDELDRLLNELTKVTTAPVLPSGATRSLINPVTNTDELLKLLPFRKRRLSEPDYDIPRSHKSLPFLETKTSTEKELRGTRFFGPVLGSSDSEKDSSSESNISMTPDSLEPSGENKKEVKNKEPVSSFEDHDASYSSHLYHLRHCKIPENALQRATLKEKKCTMYNCRKQKHQKQNLYSSPRTREQCSCLKKPSLKCEFESSDMYIDSLEQ